MSARARVRIGFLGAGTVAEMHGRGIVSTLNAEFAGAYDPDQSQARNIVERFGGRVYQSQEQLVRDGAIDAIHVLNPTKYHVETAVECLRAGKHVLVEKPVAEHIRDIAILQETAREVNRVCMPGHNYIYAPSIQRARRLITTGRLGEIASIWILYNLFHAKKFVEIYGGVLHEVCVHHVYSLLYLLGKPTRLYATTSRVRYPELTFEEQAMIVCEMPGGAIANLWCSFASSDPTNDPWTVVYKVLGTKGGVSYSWNEAQFEDPGGPAWGLPCYEEGFAYEIDHFVNRCIRNAEAPLSTLQDAVDATTVLAAAVSSARSGTRAEV